MAKAVFLDRDGTIGGSGHFCHPRDFVLYPQTACAVKMLNDVGLKVVVVTNQSHVGLGEITLEEVEASFRRLQRELEGHGAHLDAWYVCLHRPEDNCACRKPSPYLLQKAATDFALDLSLSYMVGDMGASDMLAGARAGCHTILVLTGLGRGSIGEYRHLWAEIEPDFVARDVLEAARYIADREGATRL